jgi:hypothetical protein
VTLQPPRIDLSAVAFGIGKVGLYVADVLLNPVCPLYRLTLVRYGKGQHVPGFCEVATETHNGIEGAIRFHGLRAYLSDGLRPILKI